MALNCTRRSSCVVDNERSVGIKSPRYVGRPNITGELGPALAQNSGTINNLVSGAISIDRSHDGTDLIGGSHWSAKGLAFSASQSNSVYGLSSKVQPQSILFLPYIKT